MDTSDINSWQYNQMVEDIVNVLVAKTQNYNKNFFRLQANFYLTLIPSSLNISINSKITTKIPINFFGINLADSGTGKGLSTSYLEHTILSKFTKKFTYQTLQDKALLSIDLEANKRANLPKYSDMSMDMIRDKILAEYESYGAYKSVFDSATTPAIKQFRNKLLLAGLGSLNMIIDEIGGNLKANIDPLFTYLELFDKGITKDKLIKSTSDNVRYIELSGSTPANLLLFGTPSKLLDGGSVEKDFFDLLDTGYARRCFFGISKKKELNVELSIDDLYNTIVATNNSTKINQYINLFENLSNINLCNKVLDVQESVDKLLLEYRQFCEKRALDFGEHQEIQKAELAHRYFKALKLAGTYAFLDGSFEIKEQHLQQAIKFAEDSGEALKEILYREKPYTRLAKYLQSNKGKSYTLVDLTEDLPYVRGTKNQKEELILMATTWGFTNNILIKKEIINNIPFYSGESLDFTDLEKLNVSYSSQLSDGYLNEQINWSQLPRLISTENYHWCNHHLNNGKRNEASVIPGFNLLVLDIDNGISMDMVSNLLKKYTFLIHTTKRHLQEFDENGNPIERFRIILPIKYTLSLNTQDYKKFMQNVEKYFPFSTDSATFQASRKWLTKIPSQQLDIYENKGVLFDVISLIPNTIKEKEFNTLSESISNLEPIEKFFRFEIETNGNRNNHLIRYGLMLVDSGKPQKEIEKILLNFNANLSNPLPVPEIESTIFKTIQNKLTN